MNNIGQLPATYCSKLNYSSRSANKNGNLSFSKNVHNLPRTTTGLSTRNVMYTSISVLSQAICSPKCNKNLAYKAHENRIYHSKFNAKSLVLLFRRPCGLLIRQKSSASEGNQSKTLSLLEFERIVTVEDKLARKR